LVVSLNRYICDCLIQMINTVLSLCSLNREFCTGYNVIAFAVTDLSSPVSYSRSQSPQLDYRIRLKGRKKVAYIPVFMVIIFHVTRSKNNLLSPCHLIKTLIK
jgi:hypothetical protein